MAIEFELNGRRVALDTDADRTLIWVLRGDFELTGTKFGCGEGQCGSCTVVVDGEPVRSCQTRLAEVRGKRVLTVEGLAAGERLHPLQEAFVEHGAFQCGYCTPGILMSAWALLRTKPRPTRAEIVAQLDDHLCRCGSHRRVLAAIEAVAKRPGGGS